VHHRCVEEILLETQGMLSEKLKLAILRSRLSGRRQYQLCAAAGLRPNLLSSLLHGAATVPRDDPRIIRLGAVLGVAADQCFAPDEQPELAAS
jgi:hypothetical protein